MIRAYSKIKGSAAAVERLTIYISADGGGSVAGQTLLIRDPNNLQVFYEGLAAAEIRVKIPLRTLYEISISAMDGYNAINPIFLTATEKSRIVYLNYERIPPIIGDFVYTDGSWSSNYQADKTCVGICYYVNGEDRRMLALTQPKTGSGNSCVWGPKAPEGVFISSDQNIAITDMDGRKNTDVILAIMQTENPVYNNAKDYPAANFCNNYSCDNKEKKSWWLPACGELNQIWENYEIIDQNIQVAGGERLSTSKNFWSSTGYDNIVNLWGIKLKSLGFFSQRTMNSVLPVTNF